MIWQTIIGGRQHRTSATLGRILSRGRKNICKHFCHIPKIYISLPSGLNAIIGIKSCHCVIMKMVMLHDAMKTIQNNVFVYFSKKRTKTCFFLKTQKNGLKKQKTCEFFFKLVVLHPGWSFNPFLWFSLDRTIWNKSRHYQFDWVCAAHLKCTSLVLKKLRITGIWIRKN